MAAGDGFLRQKAHARKRWWGLELGCVKSKEEEGDAVGLLLLLLAGDACCNRALENVTGNQWSPVNRKNSHEKKQE